MANIAWQWLPDSGVGMGSSALQFGVTKLGRGRVGAGGRERRGLE